MPSRYICLICRNPIPTAGAECPHCKSRATAVVGATPQMLVAVFAVMGFLVAITYWYNDVFHDEGRRRAEEHFRLARTYADYGYYEKAVENYRDALLHARGKFEYRQGLAVALYNLGEYGEAETQLLELRSLDSTDAVTNRLLARIAAREGRTEEAINYYRSAIYGRWPRHPEENRLDTRFELIELLEAQGSTYQVVGELLTVLQEEPNDTQTALRVGQQFLDLGVAGEAASLFRRLLESGIKTAEVLAGLGRAQFQLQDFNAAERYLSQALKLAKDPDIAELHALTRKILALDPTARGIGPVERYNRSKKLLEGAVTYIESCHNPLGEDFEGPDAPLPGAAQAALQLAREALAVKRRPKDLNQSTESNLLLAENLWDLRSELCVNIWQEDEVVAKLLEKLSR